MVARGRVRPATCRAGETRPRLTRAVPGAEGATAPETLRQKDRDAC
jgi:hypothetical protein